ncbi:hypothetical protein UR09_06100 [Candidatus Nitromaritima sp. SCGC AAA799-A02]|nr:hypothetical protein UR09_06100 [Candidatus Nitromaritima sp. SCGC AAA799-A02]KMP12161.1 hypothetical protein UZ36_01655 [Candidatus Nitromaritima sp. SCGC AAA799-C22]
MGTLIKADFKARLTPRLAKYNPLDERPEYQSEIFAELYPRFPQFKAHVAAYVERHYCVVVNDEDHSSPEPLLEILKSNEVRFLNGWIIDRSVANVQHQK